MKSIIQTIFVVFAFYFLQINKTNAQTYCAATNTDCAFEYITNFTLVTINNTTTCGAPYDDYTSQIAYLTAGSTYSGLATKSDITPNYALTVFIDWNKNGTFEAITEEVNATASGPSGFTFNVNVPLTAAGATRMRVRMVQNAVPSACGVAARGDIEDYTVFVSAAAPPAPANDLCVNAIPLTPTSSCSNTGGSTINATQQFAPTNCSGNTAANAKDVWYKFTADGIASYRISVTGTGNGAPAGTFNPVLALYSSCASGALIICKDTSLANQTEIINTGVLPAGTYFYRVYGNGGNGTFTTCVVDVTPQPSDDCNAPLVLTGVNPYCSPAARYTNVGAVASSFGPPVCWTTTTNDVWFQFTALGSALDVEVFGAGTGFGTLNLPQIAIYSGTCLAVLTTEGCQGNSGTGYTKLSINTLTVGTTYLIRVDGDAGNTGTFKLCVNSYNPPVLPGQDCATATQLCTKESITVNNIIGFGSNGNETGVSCLSTGTGSGGNSEQNSVWYTFTAANTDSLTFDIIPSSPGLDIDFAIFDVSSGCATKSAAISCMGSSCLGPVGLKFGDTEFIEAPGCDPADPSTGNDTYNAPLAMTAGTTYGLLINIFQNSGGGFTMNFGGNGKFRGPVANFNMSPQPKPCFPATTTVTFTDASTAATIWNWNFGAGASPASATTVGPHNVTYSTPGVKTVFLQVKNAAGCDSIITKQITIADSIHINPVVVNSTCEANNGSITVNTTGGYGSPASFTYNINGGPFGPSKVFSSLAAGTYTVVAKDSLGCTKSRTITLTTTLIPHAVVPNDITDCSGATIAGTTFSSIPVGATYTWTNTNTAIGLSVGAAGNVPSFTAANTTGSPITGTITVTPTLNGCTGPDSTYTITVKRTPTSTFSAPASVCIGANATITYTGNAAVGATYTWNFAGGTIVSGSGQGPYQISWAGTGTKGITLSVTENGCTSTITTVNVSVKALPTAAISGNATTCPGVSKTITVNLTGAAPWSITYTKDGASPVTVNNILSSPYTFTTSIAGTYAVSAVSDANCTGTFSGSAVITVNPAIVVSNVATACNGANTAYTVSFEITGGDPSTYVVTPPGSGTITPGAPYTFTSNAITSGTPYSLTVNDVYNCSAQTVSGVKDCNCAADGVISGGGTVCAGNNATIDITLVGASPWTVVYAIDGVNQAPLNNITSPYSFTTTTPGMYTLVSVADMNCTGSAGGSASVIINSLPTATIISDTVNICSGTSTNINIDLIGNPPWNLTYAIDGTDQAPVTGINSSPYVISTGAAGNYTVSAVSDANCPGTFSGNLKVNVDALPTATLISDTVAICAGATADVNIDLTGAAPWSLTYAIDGVDQTPVIANSSPYVITTGNAGNYTVSLVSDANCTGTFSGNIKVEVNPLPTAAIIPDTIDICAGATTNINIDLTGASPWSLTYAIDGVDQTPVIVNSSPYVITTGTAGNYTISAISDVNCNGTFSGNLKVNVQPVPTAAIVSGTVEICAGVTTDISISLTGSAPWNLTYAIDGVDQAPVIANSSPYIITTGLAGNYTISAVSDANCTGTASGNITVNVNPLPSATIFPDPAEVCVGTILSLTGAGSGGSGTYTSHQWTGSGAASLSDPGISNPDFINNTAAVYELVYEVTDSKGCLATDTIQVTVKPLPDPSFSGLAASYCENASAVTLVPAISGGNFTGGAIAPGSSIFDPVAAGTGIHSITYSLTVNGCSNMLIQNTTVNPLPDASFTGLGASYCIYDPQVSLTPATSGGGFSGPGTSITAALFTPAIAGAGTHNIVYTVTNAGCTNSTTQNVTVFEPNALFSATPVMGTPPLIVDFTGVNPSATSYEWDFGNGVTATGATASTVYTNIGNYLVTYIIMENGCIDSSSITIIVKDKFSITIPNVFTPNGDNINDSFSIEGSGVATFSMEIYNRWGTKVFETTDMAKGWDGKTSKGELAPTGTYFCSIKIKPVEGEEQSLNRSLNLFR